MIFNLYFKKESELINFINLYQDLFESRYKTISKDKEYKIQTLVYETAYKYRLMFGIRPSDWNQIKKDLKIKRTDIKFNVPWLNFNYGCYLNYEKKNVYCFK